MVTFKARLHIVGGEGEKKKQQQQHDEGIDIQQEEGKKKKALKRGVEWGREKKCIIERK